MSLDLMLLSMDDLGQLHILHIFNADEVQFLKSNVTYESQVIWKSAFLLIRQNGRIIYCDTKIYEGLLVHTII